jgi:hypothetical protein
MPRVSDSYHREIGTEELEAAILRALDEYGRKILAGESSTSPDTTLVAMSASRIITEADGGTYREGTVVPVRTVSAALARLVTRMQVVKVKLPGRGELRWWHIDHWNERVRREVERDLERDRVNAQGQEYRARWAAVGFEVKDLHVGMGEVSFDRETADRLLVLVEKEER